MEADVDAPHGLTDYLEFFVEHRDKVCAGPGQLNLDRGVDAHVGNRRRPPLCSRSTLPNFPQRVSGGYW